MTKICDVCCVGQACTDVFVSYIDEINHGKLHFVENATLTIGGCALNVAVDIARLGLVSSLVARVGDDAFGRFLQAELNKTGVDIKGIKVKRDAVSSMSVGLISSDGERTLMHCPGTNSTFTIDDIDKELIDQAKIVFIGGSLVMDKFDGAESAELLRYAQSKGAITAMDSSWDYSGKWMQNVEPCLPYLDWFMPSLEEAEQMLGSRDPETLADQFMEGGAKNVAIKKGIQGSFIKTADGKTYDIGIYEVESVNAAGAGDAWCAGFFAGLLKNLSIEESGRFAAANAANCVSEMSTTSGVQDYTLTLEFMKNGPYRI